MSKSINGEMSLLDHLGELRRRIIISVIILIIGSIICYSYCGVFFELLTRPHYKFFPKNSLIGTGPAEAFILKIKVSLFASLFVTSPLLFHQLWLFIAPGLLVHEKKLVIPFIGVTTILFIAGAVGAYLGLVPISIAFFQSQYDSISVTPTITVREHLSLVSRLILGCGFIAQTPVVAYFAARLKIISTSTLLSKFRHAVVIIFIIAAVVTPTPDIVTQCAFAIPLLGLYALSIGVVWLVEVRSKK